MDTVGPDSPAAGTGAGRSGCVLELDRLVHERIRLGILVALAVMEPLTFGDLKARLRTTDGNLSAHARRLEQASYITVSRQDGSASAHTAFRLTAVGRHALARYLGCMEALVRMVRQAQAPEGAPGAVDVGVTRGPAPPERPANPGGAPLKNS